MSIERILYNNSKRINQLRQLLYHNAIAGKPIDYEIYIDKLKVVPRTNNHELFDGHEEFVTDDTKSITIILYEGNSRRNNRYLFILKEERQPEVSSLSGNEADKIISEKLEKQRKQWEYELLIKEKESLENQLEEAEEYIEQLENKIEEVSNEKGKLGKQWGELASVALEGIIRRNVHKLAKIPGAAALAGVFAEDTPAPAPEENQEVEVTFQRKSVKEPDKVEQDRVNFLKILEEQLNEEEFKQLIEILNLLIEKPQALESTIEYLQEWEENNNNKNT